MFDQRPPLGAVPNAERILIAVGGAVLAIAPYLTWVRVLILGDIDLAGILSATGSATLLAYLLTAVGTGVTLTALLAPRLHVVRVLAIGTGAVVGLLGGTTIIGLIRAVDRTHGFAELGVGAILAIVGCVLILVPPVVGLVLESRQPHATTDRFPTALPAIVASIVAGFLLILPVRASTTNYCGNPVASEFKTTHSIPSDTPPPVVQSQLDADNAQITSAEQAAQAQQQADSSAQQKQASADSISAQASQADGAASDAANQVATDQDTVANDQSAVTDATDTVQNDQSTVQNDQQTVATDEQNGYDPSFDQQTLNTDQATLSADEAALATANDQLTHDQATLNVDQQKASAAQKRATTLDQQAQQAESDAGRAGTDAGTGDQQVQQQLDGAQQQLATDQQNWNEQHNSEVTAATSYNSALSACQTQSTERLTALGIVLLLGTVASLLLYRRRPGPPGGYPPPTPTVPYSFGPWSDPYGGPIAQ